MCCFNYDAGDSLSPDRQHEKSIIQLVQWMPPVLAPSKSNESESAAAPATMHFILGKSDD